MLNSLYCLKCVLYAQQYNENIICSSLTDIPYYLHHAQYKFSKNIRVFFSPYIGKDFTLEYILLWTELYLIRNSSLSLAEDDAIGYLIAFASDF